ncbi:Hypothetical protein CINCED_3A022941 [Cinara cedri]|uniref:Uncharacterized protein n=1 Tax=Cinara cedri TaxID=506608 RepID=A0A5E4NH92_9HEMI|nr:Hypothetical protein CINCED_3A022941 [Cinara cedri]
MRHCAFYRQREVHPVFKRKTKKKSLVLKTVDIKDSFITMFAGTTEDGHRHTVNAKGSMRFMNRSKIDKTTARAVLISPKTENTNENGGAHTFSIINVNDIIRDTHAFLRF